MTDQSWAWWGRGGGLTSRRPAESGFGLPAPSFMRGRPNPPCINAMEVIPAEACCRRGLILELS